MIKTISLFFAAFCALNFSSNLVLNKKAQVNWQTEKSAITLTASENAQQRLTTNPKKVAGIRENFQNYYFRNLTYNFGSNTHVTCSYLALAQFLTFYDTYWNDDFVPDNYESEPSLIENSIYDCESPGQKSDSLIARENGYSGEYGLGGLTKNEFIEYANQHANESLHYRLLTIGLNVCNYSLSISVMDLPRVLNCFLSTYTTINTNDFTIYEMTDENYDEQSVLRNRIVTTIKKGLPLILGVKDNDKKHPHAVIAYDYDEESDTIFVHGGKKTGDVEARLQLESYDFKYVTRMIWIEPKQSLLHHHTNNYYRIVDGERVAVCPCDEMIPRTLDGPDQLYLDETPTFKWNTFVEKRYLETFNAYYELSILTENNNEIIDITNLTKNCYRLTKSEYELILSATNESSFQVYVSLINPYCPADDYYAVKTFSKPTSFLNRTQIKPIDWNSSWDRVGQVSNSTITETQSFNGLTLSTKRTRAWRDGTWIAIQPKKTVNNTASLEINFDQPVYGIMYGLALRNILEPCGSVTVEIKSRFGTWTTIETISASDLTEARFGQPKRYLYTAAFTFGLFDQSIKGIRISNKNTNYHDGAICLDDIVIDTNSTLGPSLYSSWSREYGKSCYPNIIPASGNLGEKNPGVIGSSSYY